MAGYHDSKTPQAIKGRWRTPIEIYDALDSEFKFQLDVAADDNNHLNEQYLTVEDDALNPDTNWSAVNYCNPPYDSIMPWVRRCIIEQAKGNTTVLLIPADTSTKWFKLAWHYASEARFITGRISFIHPTDDKPIAGSRMGSVIFVFGKRNNIINTRIDDRDFYMSDEYDHSA